MNKYYVITAASGNPTAFKVITSPLSSAESVKTGKYLMSRFAKYEIEQTATAVIASDLIPHCEMSGGEFCGNAARAMAVLLYKLANGSSTEFRFTMSGIEKPVKAAVTESSSGIFMTTCEFHSIPVKTSVAEVLGLKVKIVDLDGIIHIVINSKLPEDYRLAHKKIVDSLNLENRDAVGVIWTTESKSAGISISPVVWVKDIDTVFFEGSCGSGSIAAAIASGQDKVRITQPTGKSIFVTIAHEQVILASEMEVLHHE